MLYINDYDKIPNWAWNIDDDDESKLHPDYRDAFNIDDLDLYDNSIEDLEDF